MTPKLEIGAARITKQLLMTLNPSALSRYAYALKRVHEVKATWPKFQDQSNLRMDRASSHVHSAHASSRSRNANLALLHGQCSKPQWCVHLASPFAQPNALCVCFISTSLVTGCRTQMKKENGGRKHIWHAHYLRRAVSFHLRSKFSKNIYKLTTHFMCSWYIDSRGCACMPSIPVQLLSQ